MNYGDPNGYTAMAKTVGYPCAIATKMVRILFFGDHRDCETNIVLTILFLGSGWRDSEEGGSSSLYKGIAQCSLKELLIKNEVRFGTVKIASLSHPNFVHFA